MLDARVDKPATFDFWDLDFDRVLVRAYTGGIQHFRSIQVGMPKIPPHVLKSTFFLYRTLEDAKQAINPEGTGFIVAIESAHYPGRGFFIGLTNWHVVRNGGSIVRINKLDGSPDFFEFDPSEWIFSPRGDDVSYIHLPLEPANHDVSAVPLKLFATEEWVQAKHVGVGDDTFMFGLFVDLQNHATNVPAARFGNISMMSHPAMQATGCTDPSIVVDMHSRTGFSGSPVFVYRTIGANLDHANSDSIVMNEGTIFGLLGIHWGQFPEEWEVETGLNVMRQAVRGTSGLTMVIPAWRLAKVILSDPKIGALMADVEQRVAAKGFDPKPVAESISPDDVESRRDAGLKRALSTPPTPHSPKPNK